MARPGKKRLLLWLQGVALIVIVVFVTAEVVRSWDTIGPRLTEIQILPLVGATVVLALYYCVFVFGWMAVLRAFGYRLGYPEALAASMLSMLAKYIPGGVWTPMSRVLAARRHGVPPMVTLASIGYEAGLSAVGGVIVFALALPFTPEVDMPVPFWTVIVFAAVLLFALHPSIYGRVADKMLGRFADGPIPRLPVKVALSVLLYYTVTWLLGGIVLLLLCRSLEHVPVGAVPYLGGASALGAIVAVLVVLAPSGLGVREGTVYALLLAYVEPSTALVVVALNRILITVVEAGLLGVAAALGAPLRLDAEADVDPGAADPSAGAQQPAPAPAPSGGG